MWVVEHHCIPRGLSKPKPTSLQIMRTAINWQAQVTCLQQRMRLIHVSVPHHWDKYHADRQDVVSARRRADEQKSNVHLAPPLSSAFPIVWTAPSAWLPRANTLTFDTTLHELEKELIQCGEQDRDSIYKQRETTINTQNVNARVSKVLSSRNRQLKYTLNAEPKSQTSPAPLL
jgi:hypothetical protein